MSVTAEAKFNKSQMLADITALQSSEPPVSDPVLNRQLEQAFATLAAAGISPGEMRLQAPASGAADGAYGLDEAANYANQATDPTYEEQSSNPTAAGQATDPTYGDQSTDPSLQYKSLDSTTGNTGPDPSSVTQTDGASGDPASNADLGSGDPSTDVSSGAADTAGADSAGGAPGSTPESLTLDDNSTISTLDDGTTRRAFPNGVTVDTMATGDTPAVLTTLPDKTTIRTTTDPASVNDSGISPTNASSGSGQNTTATVTLADGTKIRTTSKGALITRPGSNTPEAVPKGSSVKVGNVTVATATDGSSSVTMADGTKVATDGDGKTVTTMGGALGAEIASDGAVTTTAADGSRQTLDATGAPVASTELSTGVDGSTSLVSDDGSTKHTLVDKTMVETFPADGNRTRATLANGSVIDSRDVANPVNPYTGSADASAPTNADGSDQSAGTDVVTRTTTLTTADGTRVSFNKNGATFVNAKGQRDSVVAGQPAKTLPDGSTIQTAVNGTTTITAKDKSTVVVDQNGQATATTVDGSTVYPNGETKTTANGIVTNAGPDGVPIMSGTVKVESDGSQVETWDSGMVFRTLPDKKTVIASNVDEGLGMVTLPDGTKTMTGGSRLSIELPNGLTITPTENGVSYKTRSGAEVQVVQGAAPKKLSDGTTIEYTMAGEMVVTRPDKTVIRTPSDFNGATTTLPNGQVINADGSMTTTAPDGSHTTLANDGSQVDKSTITPLTGDTGTVETWDVSKKTHTNIGKISIDHDPKAGTTSSYLEQGSVDTTNDATVTRVHLSDGSLVEYANGAWQVIGANGVTTPVTSAKEEGAITVSGASVDIDDKGVMTVKFSDGTTIVTNERGSTVITNPDGSTISADGVYSRKAG